ncbi:MAG: hypothetical protein K2O22_00695 [Anaeroplasmataceae bacterium]|nr:hypothetical protein [Anaeroplasmataceae bacterium]
MRLRKYMLVDLALLTIGGFIAEFFGEYVINLSIVAGWVTGSVTLLILFLTTTRWSWKGLIPIPILCLAIVLSGRYMQPILKFRLNYDWRLYIALIISYSAISLNLLWLKKIGYEKTFKKIWLMMILCTIDYVIIQLILSVVLLILVEQFLFYALITWNLFSYIILIVGCFVLQRQNMLVNVKMSLEEKEQERKEEADFKFQFDESKIEEENDQEGVSRNGKDS